MLWVHQQMWNIHYNKKKKEKKKKQAGAELGQAQLKLGLDLKGTLSHDKNFKYVEDFTPLNTAS